jgi:hypothetical protein
MKKLRNAYDKMRITFKLKSLVILLFISQLAQAQICNIFNEVEFGEPLIKVQERVSAITESIRIIKVNKSDLSSI